MKTWQRLVAAIAMDVLLVAGIVAAARWALHKWVLPRSAMAQLHAKPWPLPAARTFTRAEAYAFLDAAQRAERIADPLQRCLAYPDPPRSHWNRTVVAAYCRYRYQPIVTLADVRRLIANGQAAGLDRELAEALRAQRTRPDARSRLDRIYDADFNGHSPELRALVDAWQRQAPDSGFAAAASGMVYAKMAFAARGAQYLRDTPQSNIDSMDRLARRADADLQRAIRLNPALAPAYEAMENVGGYSSLGCGYAWNAAEKGLAVDPDDFALYDTLMWLAQPKWCGSEAALQTLWQRADARAARNPLLALVKPAGEFKLIDACKCSETRQLAAYTAVLDRVATARELLNAGDTARDVNDPQATVIYLSEALRFDAALEGARLDRTYGLVEFDDARWAIDEANRMLAVQPDNEYAYKARAWAYLQGLNDLPAAQRDFERATALDPKDAWALARLGGVYIENGRQWRKAEDVADRLIALDPDKLDGWSLRASVQSRLHEPALAGTLDQISRRFGSDPRIAAEVARARAALAKPAAAATAGGRHGGL